MLNYSQRDGNFKGGIQAGTVAWDESSLLVDKLLKEGYKTLSNEFKNLKSYKQFTKAMKLQYVGDDCFGFAPDGGAWFKDGKLVAVFEAKKQNEGGNAYERWWDNASTAKYLNPDVIYVTFCSGRGAKKDNCLDKLKRKANIMLGKNFEFYLSETGFTSEYVLDVMRQTLSKV